jgi:hypothetical protein
MPLLDLKTDLKSLKYGQDTPGGGNSREPYIKVDINKVDSGFNQFRLTKFDDGLVRGGIVGALNASVVDTLRIGKFFADFPKGPLFLVKQVGLQLSNPRLEVPKNPANIAAGGINNTLSVSTNGLLQPTRIYNLGINTILQVPINAIGGHILRHGLLPFTDNDNTKYEAIVTANNSDTSKNNRLVSLAKNFGLSPNTTPDPTKDQLLIDKYLGGPNSVYGIGNTVIKKSFDVITNNFAKISSSLDFSKTYAGKAKDPKGQPVDLTVSKDFGVSNFSSSIFVPSSFSDLPTIKNPNSPLPNNIANQGNKQNPFKYETEVNYANTLGVSKLYFSNSQEILSNTGIDINNPTNKPPDLDLATYSKPIEPDIIIGNPVTQTRTPVINSSYDRYKKIIESRKLTEVHYVSGSNPVNQFGIYGNESYTPGVVRDYGGNNILPDTTTYPVYYNGDKTVNIKIPWDKVTREIRIGSGKQDSINLTRIFGGTMAEVGDKYFMGDEVATIDGKKHNIRDLVKFRISSVLTDTPERVNTMIFRAYLTQLTDSVDATWNDVKYAGRGNKFYIYDGFTRKIQIGFKVAALSAEEMSPMYSKLNYLMSTLMPDYNNGLMRGPLVRMTVGNYFDAQLGKLDSLSYTIPQDSPWEIALDEPEGGSKQLILPHILEVSLGFTPIGAETQGANKIEQKIRDTTYLAQNNTGTDKDTIQYYDYFSNKFD